jgi:hypothetical protein
MKPISNYDKTATYSETASAKLPAGAYLVRIIRAEERDNTLCILFDIYEGEYKDYFADKFAADKRDYPDSAKYKGVYRLWYENPAKDEKSNERSRRAMKTALERIKSSNNLNIDFSKEWDGAALKGCLVGMIFREEEYSFNGYTGFSARPYSLLTLDAFKAGAYTLPEPKRLRGSAAAVSGTAGAAADIFDDDLPF